MRGVVVLSPASRIEIRTTVADMKSKYRTFALDKELALQATRLGIDISRAARAGVAAAVRQAQAMADRDVYARQPERVESSWATAETWGAD